MFGGLVISDELNILAKRSDTVNKSNHWPYRCWCTRADPVLDTLFQARRMEIMDQEHTRRFPGAKKEIPDQDDSMQFLP